MEPKERAFALYIRGYSKQEIAKKMGKPIGTINSWMSRGNWAERKRGFQNPDGTINQEILNKYASLHGCPTIANGQPLEEKAAALYETEKDRETASFVAKTINNALRWFYTRPPENETEFEMRLFEYFSVCENNGIPPTMEGLWLSLGISYTTFYEWIHGKSGTVFAELSLKAHATVKECDAQLAISGRMPQVLYIFRAKNFHGMKDVVESTITHRQEEGTDVDEIARRLSETSPIEDAEFSEIPIDDIVGDMPYDMSSDDGSEV